MPSKWLRDHRKQDLRDHKKRIENMKSTIDTAPPRELPMSKRNEMERERKRALVEQDNRLLLDRLAIAMSTKNIDNVLVEKPFISLMELQRKKQLKKIMIQNSRLLDRIQCTVPSYDHVQWEREAEHHVEILRNMTDFPDLFVAPGCHKKGYDMAIIDAERAQQKLIANRGVERSASASPSKQRAGQEAAGVSGVKSSKKGGAGAANTKSGGNSKSNGNGNGAGGEGSPHSQGSRASGYVPYSYFPEEQYAQYQMQLQMQMQLQAQQQQQQQMQLQHPQYQQQQQYMYDQSQSQHTQGQMQDPNIGQFSPQYAQQSQQQLQQQTPYYNQQYQQSPPSQYVQSAPYVQSDTAYGAGVQFAPTLSPEQQYAHQQQLLLYHQQQQRLKYNNGSTNSNSANNMNANSNVYQNQPYNNTNTNYTPQLAPLNNTNINPQQQYAQYSNGSTQNVQLPNIYMLPPGHVAQPAYYNNNA